MNHATFGHVGGWGVSIRGIVSRTKNQEPRAKISHAAFGENFVLMVSRTMDEMDEGIETAD